MKDKESKLSKITDILYCSDLKLCEECQENLRLIGDKVIEALIELIGEDKLKELRDCGMLTNIIFDAMESITLRTIYELSIEYEMGDIDYCEECLKDQGNNED